MYITLWENFRGHPENVSFMQFSQNIDGFKQNPLEKFYSFTISQNYTLALRS